MEYVDLFLIHWPVTATKSIDWSNVRQGDFQAVEQKELWQAMESCMDAGLAKAIGVSNWSIKKLQELLLHARIPPAVNQVRSSLARTLIHGVHILSVTSSDSPLLELARAGGLHSTRLSRLQ